MLPVVLAHLYHHNQLMSPINFAKEQPLSVRDACELLKISKATLYRWFQQGLEHAKLGGKRFTSRESLDRFAKMQEPSPAAKALAQSYSRRRSREEMLAEKALHEEFGFDC